MILRGDDERQFLHARKLIRLRNEAVLDGPPPADDRLLGVGGFVRGEHFVDRRVADGVRRDPPAETIQLLDDLRVRRLLHRVDAEERAAFAPRLGVRLAHPAAFEAAIDAELHAADADPFVAFVWRDARCRDRRAHRRGAVGAESHQLIDTHRQRAAPLHLLEQPVLLDRRAGIADARQTDSVQLSMLLLQRLRSSALGRRRQLHERFRAVDELAVQLA